MIMNYFIFSCICLLVIFLITQISGVVVAEMQRMIGDPNCPGMCLSILDCKSTNGKILGMCANGKVCCNNGGFVPSNIPVGSCGSSFMARKVSSFQSPNYPYSSGGNLVCEFNLQLNPATVGIRVDFLDLNLASIPSNPATFFESPNPICDSDFMMLKGFSGWAPDIRCGNLTGYSLMIEREKGQALLSTVFIMASTQYKWNVQYTEIFHSEVELLDYSIRNTGNSGTLNDKKHWIFYSSGISPPLSMGPGPPVFPSSMIAPQAPNFQFYPYSKRNAEILPQVEVPHTDTGSTLNLSDDVKNEVTLESPITGSPLSRIIGGIDAQPNSIPWQVSLQLVEKIPSTLCGESVRNMSAHFCGGTIIGEKSILTASHCFFSSPRYTHPLVQADSVKVVVGEHDLCNDNEVTTTREYSIERVVLHFNYLSADVINDIAVIHLNKPIMFDQNVHPIKLADEYTKIEALKPLLSGWGSLGVEENSTYPAILQQTSNFQMFSDQECHRFQREFLDYVVTDSKLPGKYKGAFDNGICTIAADNVTEAGFGDSGGPLVGLPPSSSRSNTASHNAVLLGVVSHMRPHINPKTNLTFHMNFFAKVAAYRKWIMMSMV